MLYIPQADQFSAIESFVRAKYNPDGNPEIAKSLVLEPYSYPVNFLNLLAGKTATDVLNVAATADFVLLHICANVLRSGAALMDSGVTGGLKCLLTDTGSQNPLMAEPQELQSLVLGQYTGRANPLPYPRIISGRSGLSVQLTNTTNVMAETVTFAAIKMTFVGVLVRQYG